MKLPCFPKGPVGLIAKHHHWKENHHLLVTLKQSRSRKYEVALNEFFIRYLNSENPQNPKKNKHNVEKWHDNLKKRLDDFFLANLELFGNLVGTLHWIPDSCILSKAWPACFLASSQLASARWSLWHDSNSRIHPWIITYNIITTSHNHYTNSPPLKFCISNISLLRELKLSKKKHATSTPPSLKVPRCDRRPPPLWVPKLSAKSAQPQPLMGSPHGRWVEWEKNSYVFFGRMHATVDGNQKSGKKTQVEKVGSWNPIIYRVLEIHPRWLFEIWTINSMVYGVYCMVCLLDTWLMSNVHLMASPLCEYELPWK